MTSKTILNQRLAQASTLRESGRFKEALDVLNSLQADPQATLLGHRTSLELPRRLHSAFLKLAKAEKDELRRIGYQFHLVPPPDVLNKYAMFAIAERKNITQANKRPVPKKIHQIWIGKQTNPPAGTEAWREHAAIHHLEYQLWRDENLHELGIEDNAAYRHMMSRGDYPGAVDVARYIILQRFGGVYLDCDWYPVRNDISFHDLLPMAGLIAMPERIPRNTGKGSTLLANSFIAAPPDHPVLERLNTALPEITAELPKAPAWWSTGPLIFTLMSRGGSLTLADADLVSGELSQDTTLSQVKRWCEKTRLHDSGLLLAWRSWAR